MKGNAKCIFFVVLIHPLDDLGVTHRVHLWLDQKRIVDFSISDNWTFSLALTAEALKRDLSKSAFYECKF